MYINFEQLYQKFHAAHRFPHSFLQHLFKGLSYSDSDNVFADGFQCNVDNNVPQLFNKFENFDLNKDSRLSK